jgi:hypothetical protein
MCISFSPQATDVLEQMEKSHPETMLNPKQKMAKLKSVRRLLRAKSVREVVNGLKSSVS